MQAESVVVLAQSFVLARLLTQRSAYWTSWHGYHRAALLPAQPFVALRVRFTEFGCDNVHLFIVSPTKRTSGLYADCDLPLVLQPGNARLDDALRAVPPLPTSTRQLYLHTFPALKTQRGIGGMLQDEESDKFKLEEPSFQRFWSKAWSEAMKFRKKEWGYETMKPRSSGGDEAVQDNWDTFSKDVNDVEHLHDPFGRCVFERLEFKDLPLTEEPSIYRELAIYDQLAADYSWRGVKRSIYWVEALRKFANEGSFAEHSVVHGELCSGELPSFSGDLKEDALALRAMQIPEDGDPPPASAAEEVVEVSWGDEPGPDFSSAPEALPPVVASDIKVVVFDLYGAIMDRQEALRRALSTFISLDPHQHTVDDLLRLYLDVEAHRIRETPGLYSHELAHGTLSNILHIIGLHPAGDMVQRAVDAICPTPYTDVTDALRTLQQRGYKLLYLVPRDASRVSDTGSLLPPDIRTLSVSTAHLHTQSKGVCSQVVEECQSIIPEIKNTEILLVTTGLYRIVELANAAGIPTALVQRPSVDEARLERATEQDELSSPTMTIGGLGELCDKLDLMR
ncbi:hypothetical protein POSPLADRAFT_1115601, partial [Postia placenta MAD-698-R-SB12]